MKDSISKGLEIILDNFKVLIPLQIMNQLVGSLLIYPLASRVMNFAYQYQGRFTVSKVQGFELSLENIGLFILVFVLLGLYYFYVLASFIILADDMVLNKTSRILEKFKQFLIVIRSNMNLELLKSVFLISLVMPLSLFALLNSVIIPIHLPEFIIDFLKYSDYYRIFANVFLVLINTYALFLMFGLYDVFINGSTLKKAHQNNRHFIKKHIKMIGIALLTMALTTAVIVLIYILSTLVLVFVSRQFFSVSMGVVVFNTVHSGLKFLFSSFIAMTLLLMVVLMVVSLKQEIPIESESNQKLSRLAWRVGLNILLISLVFSLVFTVKDQVHLNLNEIEIVGHRVGVLDLPENSLLALEVAIERDYNMVEIDIQQLKDGEIVVVHDPTFSRLAGVNKKVTESTYPEVLDLDPLYTHPQLNLPKTHFATWDEFAAMAKDNIDIMLEVKTNPSDESFLGDIFAVIDKYDMLDQIQMSSMDKKLLKDIKTMNPQAQTTYIATALIGDPLKDDFIDNYSLQLDLLTSNVIKRVRQMDKKLYVWTPNQSKTITKSLSLDIDGIVTDCPELVRFHIKNPGYSLIDELWNELFFNAQESELVIPED